MSGQLARLISRDSILYPLVGDTKDDLLATLTDFLAKRYALETDTDRILGRVLKREAQFSTGIGRGIAIPHAEIGEVREPRLVVGFHPGGADFDSVDDEPVFLVFLLVFSPENSEDRLAILSEISQLLRNFALLEELRDAKNADELVKILTEK
ncbi:MAG: PTS sugar transporter subunit IIA [Gemmatimonadetes bacterium]|nr:PTS sugar transporter subunit IIA [Gemmatimonadota bacterium]